MRWFAFLLTPLFLLGQNYSNTITVSSAVGGSSPAATLAAFDVTVAAGLDQTVDDAVGVVAGLGITRSGLASVSVVVPQGRDAVTRLAWTFRWLQPFSNMKAATALLGALQKAMIQNKSAASLSYAVQAPVPAPSSGLVCDLGAAI